MISQILYHELEEAFPYADLSWGNDIIFVWLYGKKVDRGTLVLSHEDSSVLLQVNGGPHFNNVPVQCFDLAEPDSIEKIIHTIRGLLDVT